MEEVEKRKTPSGITLVPVIYGNDLNKYLRPEESQRYWRLKHLIAEEKKEELDFKKLKELVEKRVRPSEARSALKRRKREVIENLEEEKDKLFDQVIEAKKEDIAKGWLARDFDATWQEVERYVFPEYQLKLIHEEWKYCEECEEWEELKHDDDPKLDSLKRSTAEALLAQGRLIRIYLTPIWQVREEAERKRREEIRRSEMLAEEQRLKGKFNQWVNELDEGLRKFSNSLYKRQRSAMDYYKGRAHPEILFFHLSPVADYRNIYKKEVKPKLESKIPVPLKRAGVEFDYHQSVWPFPHLIEVGYEAEKIPSINLVFSTDLVYEVECSTREQSIPYRVEGIYGWIEGDWQCPKKNLGYFYHRVPGAVQIDLPVPIPLLRGILEGEIEPERTKAIFKSKNQTSYRVQGLKEDFALSKPLKGFLQGLKDEEGSFGGFLLKHKLADEDTIALIERKLQLVPTFPRSFPKPAWSRENILSRLDGMGFTREQIKQCIDYLSTCSPQPSSEEEAIEMALKYLSRQQGTSPNLG